MSKLYNLIKNTLITCKINNSVSRDSDPTYGDKDP